MRIGLVLGLSEAADRRIARWEHLRAQAAAAESAGFDLVTLSDAISAGGRGFWEGMTMAGAVAASTTSIGVAHSIVNPPYREPAVVARAADTLDEITGGRYTLGIGAGDTPDDYAGFGMDAEPRFSRLAEAVEVIAALLRTGTVDFDGRFERAHADWWSPRGPRRHGPPIVIAAGGPKMVGLTARLADGWNWWADVGSFDHLPPILSELERGCAAAGRDPVAIERSIDLYTFDPLGENTDGRPGVHSGSAEEMADTILTMAGYGIDEVRISVYGDPAHKSEAAVALADVVSLVHSA